MTPPSSIPQPQLGASASDFPIMDSWQNSLRLRPLLWLAPCVIAGGMLGFHLATLWGKDTAMLFFVACGFLVLSLLWRGRVPLASRLAFGAFCFLGMSAYAALRVLPAQDDISHLASENMSRDKPLQANLLTVRGYVADHPQRGEFSTQFPLHCIERDEGKKRVPAKGRIWVTAPPNATVQVGDAIQLQGELRPLPRSTNPGQHEQRWRYVLEHCWSRLRVKENRQIKALRATPQYPFARRIAAWRSALLTHYQSAFEARGTPYPRANAQLLTAMTFGEGGLSTPLPYQVREDFRVAGLSHVLVASGSQIALFGALLLGLGKLFGLRNGWLLALVLPTLLLYATLAGGAPSIARATIAGAVVTVAVLAGRDIDGLSLWSLALGGIVAFDPAQLMSLSLQLSFAATWGLIALAPILQHRFQGILGKSTLTDLLTFSLGAQLGVLPILLYHFGRISIAGLAANLLGVPLAGMLVGTGMAGLVLPLAWLNEFLTLGIARIAVFFAELPGAQIETPPVRLPTILGCYALIVLAMFYLTTLPGGTGDDGLLAALRLEMLRWWQKRQAQLPSPKKVVVVLFLAAALYGGFWSYEIRPQALRLAMLDVGQGESLVVITPEKRVVLIDGGGEPESLRVNVGQSVIVPYLQARGVKRIDALVITHADADHCNGLLGVLREIPVDMVIDGGRSEDVTATEYQELKREIARRKIPITPARAGQQLRLGSASLRVLAPLPPLLEGDNNNSVVMRLEYGRTSFLLTGDIESQAEERLASSGTNLKCTVLKAAHHGSQTSTSELLLQETQPQLAIISCGRYNRFGHPSAGVLRRLNAQKIPVFRTDLDGAIEVLSDGQKCWIQTTQ